MRSARAVLPSGITQLAVVTSRPGEPLAAATTCSWRIVPIFARSSGSSASELFQKSTPFTSPWLNQKPTWCGWSTRSPGRGSSGKPRVTRVPFAVRIG